MRPRHAHAFDRCMAPACRESQCAGDCFQRASGGTMQIQHGRRSGLRKTRMSHQQRSTHLRYTIIQHLANGIAKLDRNDQMSNT